MNKRFDSQWCVVSQNSRGLPSQVSERCAKRARQLPHAPPHWSLQISTYPYISAFTVGDQLLWGAAEPLRRMLRILLEHRAA